MLSTFLDKAGGLLNRRFLVAYWFPTLFAAPLLLLPRALVYGLDATWRWWAGLVPPQDYAGEGSPQLVLLAGSLLLITLVAYLLQAFTRLLVHAYEGYTWPFPLRRWAAGRVARRWQALKRERTAAARQNDMARYAHRQDQLHHEYPDRAELLLPTHLGNVLRAAEGYGGRAYGDVVLYLSGCRIPHRAWWAAGVLALDGLLCFAAYRGAVAQARGYGQQIRTAIDLYRFELLKALHLPLPAAPQEERALWSRLAAWLYNTDLGAMRELVYDVGMPDQEAKD